MKRVGNLYEKICDTGNIKQAILSSSRGKRDQKRVKHILNNIDVYAERVRRLLITQSYVPSPYAVKTVRDGAAQKERTIHKPRYYPDQIIHWALMLQLQPVIEARDVPWGAFRQAMDLMEHAAHNLNLLCTAEYARKLSRLEQELRAATTDEGWDVYLEIDTLRSDEAARRAAQRRPRRACCCSQRNQFMTSRSS